MRREVKIVAGLVALTSTLIAAVSVFLKVNSKVVEYQAGNKTISKITFFGKPMAEREYENGKLNGLTKIFYQNGKLKSEFYFKDDQLDGLAKQYDQEGELVREDFYEMGKKIQKKTFLKGNTVLDEKIS